LIAFHERSGRDCQLALVAVARIFAQRHLFHGLAAITMVCDVIDRIW